MESNCGLIVFEESMKARFAEIARIHGLRIYQANLRNNYSDNKLKNLIQRILSKRELLDKKSEIESFIRSSEFDKIYISAAEGYVSHNIMQRLRKEFPNETFVVLQHGIFPLRLIWWKEWFRGLMNYIGQFLFGIYPLGAGFGGIHLDEYYVYSNREKNFLVTHRKWKEDQVQVKFDFIKADLSELKKNMLIDQDPRRAVFLMQCLSLSGLCSQQEERNLIQSVIHYLSSKYDEVLIKPHPACYDLNEALSLPENCSLISEMLEGFSRCKFAYSFFSTALVDAKFFHLTTVGIRASFIRVDKEIFTNFDKTLIFEEDILSQI